MQSYWVPLQTCTPRRDASNTHHQRPPMSVSGQWRQYGNHAVSDEKMGDSTIATSTTSSCSNNSSTTNSLCGRRRASAARSVRRLPTNDGACAMTRSRRKTDARAQQPPPPTPCAIPAVVLPPTTVSTTLQKQQQHHHHHRSRAHRSVAPCVRTSASAHGAAAAAAHLSPSQQQQQQPPQQQQQQPYIVPLPPQQHSLRVPVPPTPPPIWSPWAAAMHTSNTTRDGGDDGTGSSSGNGDDSHEAKDSAALTVTSARMHDATALPTLHVPRQKQPMAVVCARHWHGAAHMQQQQQQQQLLSCPSLPQSQQQQPQQSSTTSPAETTAAAPMPHVGHGVAADVDVASTAAAAPPPPPLRQQPPAPPPLPTPLPTRQSPPALSPATSSVMPAATAASATMAGVHHGEMCTKSHGDISVTSNDNYGSLFDDSNNSSTVGNNDSAQETSCVSGSSLLLDATTRLPSVSIVHGLGAYEEEEVRGYYPEVYFTGAAGCAKVAGQRGMPHNDGYDDANGYYRLVLGDHIAYRYEVVKELGRGTFGIVAKAFDHKRGEHVALKLIRNRPAYLRQAREEVRLLSMLRDDDASDVANVVHMHTSFLFRNHCILVFELLAGDLYSLMQIRKFAPFRMRFVRDFARQMLVALDFVRAHNIIHCDIKPENIALCQLSTTTSSSAASPPPPPLLLQSRDKHTRATRSGSGGSGVRFKLIDFGSACVSGAQLYTYVQSRYYRAPEVVLGVTYTMMIDMWSFGCVLCELVRGRPIFPASSDADLLERIAEYLGECPRALRERGRRSSLFYAKDGTPLHTRGRSSSGGGGAADEARQRKTSATAAMPRRVPGSRTLHAFLGTASDDEHACAFVSFIAGCLTYDPEARMTPKQALQHPWLRQQL